MEFPRLHDTSFPHLDNLNAYQFKNNFDYSRWQADVTIKLCSVAWNESYEHVVDFKTNKARDSYFDDLKGEVITLTADSRRVSDSIRVPLPYDVAAQYNYVCLLAPYPGIDYQKQDVRRMYYFISEVAYAAPNATELVLTLDVWTTYINDIDINYLMLERGHAPMDAITVNDYLSNPIEHTKYLSAQDVTFSSGNDKIKTTETHALGAGDKLVIFASSIPYENFNSSIVVGDSVTASSPTFSDTSDRYGYQLQVNGYTWNTGRVNNSRINSTPSSTQGNIPSYSLYAIKASDLFSSNGWSNFQSQLGVFLKSIDAVFIMPRNMIQLGNSWSKGNFTIYRVSYSNYQLADDFNLTVDKFNYPSAYKNIAKLYTFPYAYLEFSDDASESIIVRIEDISGNSVEAVNMLSLAFPFLEWKIGLANVGVSGTNSYTWTQITGDNITAQDYKNELFKWSITLGIPTYALFMSGAAEVQTDYQKVLQARDNALLAYQNTVRSTNTGHANNVDANATMRTNTTNNGNTAVANTALSVAASSANVTTTNYASTMGTIAGNAVVAANRIADASLQSTIIDTKRDAMAATNTNSMLGSIAGGAISGGGSSGMLAAAAGGAAAGAALGPGGIIAGAAIGMASGAMSGAISSAVGNQNSVIAFNASAAIASATEANANTHASNTTTQSTTMTRLHTNAQTDTVNTNNQLATSSTANNVSLANTNAANSQATNDANSQYSRNISVLNAQYTLRNAQDNYNYQLSSAAQNRPSTYGAYSGNPEIDAFAKRVLSMRVKTQSDSAIAQTGDYFLRYGYAFNGVWNVEDWTTKKFSYWKASEVWTSTNNYVTDSTKLTIEAILKKGVTIWNNPSEVGRVSIYER